MDFDPSSAAPVEEHAGGFDPSTATAFDPGSAQAVEEPGILSRVGSSLGRIGRAGWEGLTEGAGEKGETILSPEAQAKLDAIQQQGGWKGRLAQFGSQVGEDIGAVGHGIAGTVGSSINAVNRAVEQTGQEIGIPALGTAFQAAQEAFPQEMMGMEGVLGRSALGAHAIGTPEAIHADIAQARQTADAVRAQKPAPEPTPAAPGRPILSPEAAARQEEGVDQPHPEPPPAQPDLPVAPPAETITPSPPTVAPVEPPVASPPPASSNPASGFVMLRPGDLKVDPERFQYKESGDRGVTGALSGVTRWEPALANPITAWQSADGDMFVVNGHQRHDLATRAEAAGQTDVQIPTRIFREQDGYTPDFMRVLGAYQNIAEGSGTPIDAAKVLRGKDAIPTEMVLPQLPPRSQMVQQAQSLAKLSPNAFGMVENGVVSPSYAATVGDLITDPHQQETALSILARADPANVNQARMIVQDVRNSGFLTQTQQGLFGEEAFAKSLVPERAKVLDGSMQVLRRTKGLYKAAVEGEEELTSAGNQLNTEANAQAKTANERLLDIIQREATNRGPISDALSAAARDLADGKPRSTVQSQFLAKARQIVARGEDQGVEPGAVHGGEGHEGPPEPPVEGQTGMFDPGTATPLEARKAPLPPPTGPDLFGGERAEPARRTPEPTIKGDPRQAVMPGMEPTAKQAQASREAAGPRGNQLPPDQGLFARPETKQPELLPDSPPDFLAKGSRFDAAMGPGGVDMLHTVENRMGGHDAARDWVLKMGRETGNEHVAMVDNRTGEIVHAHTNGKPRSVDIDVGLLPNEPDAYTIHHNHPSNAALSPADNGMLAHPAISHVVAHGVDGDTYHSSIGPLGEAIRRYDPATAVARYHGLKEAADNRGSVAASILSVAVRLGQMSLEDAKKAYWDVANRLLAARGVTNYSSTFSLPKSVAKVLTDAAAKDIRNDPRQADRLTHAVLPEERHSGLPQGDGGRPGTGSSGHPARDPLRQEVPGGARQTAAGRGQQGRLLDQETGLEAPRQPNFHVPNTPQFDVLRDKKGLDKLATELKAWFTPATLRGAKPMEREIRLHGATAAQSYAQSAAALSKVRDAIDGLSKEAQIEFTNRMETGQRQPTPELQKVADALRGQIDDWTRRVQGLGRGYLANAIHDYMGHIWGNYAEWAQGHPTTRTPEEMQAEAQARAQGKVPLLGSKAFLKQRTFPTQLEGINAGLIPITYNPVDLQLLKLREMQKFYHGTKFADELKAKNIAQWVPAGMERQAAAEGLTKLDDRVFQPRLTGDANPAGFGRLEPGNWYAPDPAARLFNNYMSRGLAGQSAIYDATRVAGNALNMMQLGVSGFHATFVTMDTMKSQVALAMRQIGRGLRNGDLGLAAKGALNLGTGLTPAALVDAVRTGERTRAAWLNPANATPQELRLAQMLNEGGGRISMDQFYRSNAAGPFFHSLADLKHPLSPIYSIWQAIKDEPSYIQKPIVAAGQIVGRTLETINQPLMGYLVPRAKVGVFSKMAQDWLDANPGATPEERSDAMIKAWDSVDNRLGQLVYDNLFWNKTGKDLAFLTMRSVGWNVGTVREVGGGVIDTARAVQDIVRGRNPEFTHRMAYIMAMPIVTGLYGALMTYAATGKGPQDLLDYFFPPTGGKTPAGDPERRNIPGYEKDIIEFTRAPGQTVLNKINPLAETAKELYQNEDYYGGGIYNPELGDKRLPAYADYLLNQAIPFSWRGAARLNKEGSSLQDQALSFWGFQPASKAITQPEVAAKWDTVRAREEYRKRAKEPGRIDFFQSSP